jgi:hypothetical protein
MTRFLSLSRLRLAGVLAAGAAALSLAPLAQAQSGHWHLPGAPEVRADGSRACMLMWQAPDGALLSFTRRTDANNPGGPRLQTLTITGDAVARVSDGTDIMLTAPSGRAFTVNMRKSANPNQARTGMVFLDAQRFDDIVGSFRNAGPVDLISMTYPIVELTGQHDMRALSEQQWNQLTRCFQQL